MTTAKLPTMPASRQRISWWAQPLLGPMLRQRGLCIGLAGIGMWQVVAGLMHWVGVWCPMLHLMHVPCLTCGVSRACAAILRGDWRTALALHAFAPLFLIAATLFLACAILPARPRDATARTIEHIERCTAIVKLALVLLVLYWIARLAYSPSAFYRVVQT